MDTEILNKAKYYCARAERSPRNLRLFLMRREVPSDEIDEYLTLLEEGRYYDPQRYAVILDVVDDQRHRIITSIEIGGE